MLSQTSLYWRKLLVVGPFKKENAYLRRVIRNKKIAFETAQQQRADNLLQEISLLGSWYLRSFIQAVRTGILEIKQTDWEEDECTMPRPSGSTGRILSIRSQSANVDHQSGRVLDSVQLQRFLRLVIRSGIIVETVTYSLNKKLPESQAALVATLLAHRHVTLSSSSSSTTSTTVDVTKSNVIEVMERHYFMIALKVACDAYAAKEPMGKRERRK